MSDAKKLYHLARKVLKAPTIVNKTIKKEELNPNIAFQLISI